MKSLFCLTDYWTNLDYRDAEGQACCQCPNKDGFPCKSYKDVLCGVEEAELGHLTPKGSNQKESGGLGLHLSQHLNPRGLGPMGQARGDGPDWQVMMKARRYRGWQIQRSERSLDETQGLGSRIGAYRGGGWLSVCVCVCVCVCVSHSVMSNCLCPRGLWPTSLLCPWASPGKNTGVGCYSLLHWVWVV